MVTCTLPVDIIHNKSESPRASPNIIGEFYILVAAESKSAGSSDAS